MSAATSTGVATGVAPLAGPLAGRTDPTTGAAPLAGRTTIGAKALDRVVAGVASQALGVSVKQVSAKLTDEAGLLGLSISAPIRLDPLERLAQNPGSITRAGGTVLERAERARRRIHAEVESITGSTVSRVEVRLTGVQVEPGTRVQ